jgi:ribosome-associated translation inhibitor RaiA
MIHEVHMTEAERQRLEARLAEIEAKMANAKEVNVHLTMLDGERRSIREILELHGKTK